MWRVAAAAALVVLLTVCLIWLAIPYAVQTGAMLALADLTGPDDGRSLDVQLTELRPALAVATGRIGEVRISIGPVNAGPVLFDRVVTTVNRVYLNAVGLLAERRLAVSWAEEFKVTIDIEAETIAALLAESPGLSRVNVVLGDGTIRVSGQMALGARELPFEVTGSMELDDARVRFVPETLTLDGHDVPPGLTGLVMELVSGDDVWLDLAALDIPLTITTVDIYPGVLRITATGRE